MGAQRGAQESRQNDFIKINCTFVSFFITLFFIKPCEWVARHPKRFAKKWHTIRDTLRMGGLPPEAFREEMAHHSRYLANGWLATRSVPRRVVGGIGLEPTTFTMST